MKSTSRTNKASLQDIAPGRALLVMFAASLATLGFALSANGNERKTTIITFDVPGAQGTQGETINSQGTNGLRCKTRLRSGGSISSRSMT